MHPDHAIVYRILRAVARRELNLSMPGFIGYEELSQQYAQQTEGHQIDYHFGWNEPLAEIDRRCVGLFHEGFRPVLSVLVVRQDGDGRPGSGFWGIRMQDGREVTPAQGSDRAWVEIVRAVYAYDWPPELHELLQVRWSEHRFFGHRKESLPGGHFEPLQVGIYMKVETRFELHNGCGTRLISASVSDA